MSKYCKNTNCGKLNPNPLNKYCSFACDTRPKKIYSAPKQIGRKRAARFAAWDSEVLAFKKVYEREQNCWICWKFVHEPAAWCFPHLLAKSSHPALRTLESNIWFVCWEQHHAEIDKLVVALKREGQEEELQKAILNWDFEKVEKLLKIKWTK